MTKPVDLLKNLQTAKRFKAGDIIKPTKLHKFSFMQDEGWGDLFEVLYYPKRKKFQHQQIRVQILLPQKLNGNIGEFAEFFFELV